jgi:hypothetical protein
MASASQKKFMVALSLCAGVANIMYIRYSEKPGRERIKKHLVELHDMGMATFEHAHGAISLKETTALEDLIQKFEADSGLLEVQSFQTFISLLIGIISEREQEISGFSPKSNKLKPLAEITKKLEVIHTYFYSRTRNDDHDVEACRLLEFFNKIV